MSDCRTDCHNGDCLRRWFDSPLGRELAAAEQRAIEAELVHCFGYHAALIGSLQRGRSLIQGSPIRHQIVVEATGEAPGVTLAARPDALPFAADSVDLLVLHHALEFSGNPHQILREAERVLIPDGRLIILGFNPLSPWGLRRLVQSRRGQPPWCGTFIGTTRLRDWLTLLGFEVDRNRALFHRPPLNHAALLERMAPLEAFGERWWRPFSAVHMMVARKQVVTLTPIRPSWHRRRSLARRPRLVEPTARRTQINK